VNNPAAPQAPDTDVERKAPPFDPEIVDGVLTMLDKTVRAHQLYNANNPTYIKMLEAMRASFAPLWAETDSLTLQVTDTSFIWFGTPLHVQDEKASDSLPWTLYKDGLRELTITPGFEGEELDSFLAVIPRVRKALPQDDDLLTILWEQEYEHLSYRHVELAVEGVPIDTGAASGMWPVTPGEVVESPMEAIEAAKREADGDETGAAGAGGDAPTKARPAGVVSMDDFDSTLYFLEEEEVRYLKAELGAEYATDLRRVVLDGLFDIFELQPEPLVRQEVVGHIDSLTLHLLAGRQFGNVAYLMREANSALERARDVHPQTRARLEGLSDRLSEPNALSQLLQAMDEAESLPPKADLEQLFMQLRPSALGVIFAWLGQSQNLKLRPLLEAAADRLASANTGEVVRLIASGEGHVAMEAVRRAGALKTPAAVGALGKVLNEPFRDLRVAAVAALADIGTAGALQTLEKAIDDADRDVRLAAIKAITVRVHKPALPRITTIVKSKEIRDADRTERLAIFELFGMLCGDGGVAFLDDVLNGKGGLFGRKDDPEIRACAAVALGKIGTARSQASLQKAAGEKDVVVRNAVNRANRGPAA
jgi:hypothetical protein